MYEYETVTRTLLGGVAAPSGKLTVVVIALTSCIDSLANFST